MTAGSQYHPRERMGPTHH